MLDEYLGADYSCHYTTWPELSILTYLIVPFSKCILIGRTLMQLLNEMKRPICKDTSPSTRYNIENNTLEPEFISCWHAVFLKTSSNYRIDMRVRLKWETMASCFYLFELESSFLILVRQDDSPDCRFYIMLWNMIISGYVWNGGMAF